MTPTLRRKHAAARIGNLWDTGALVSMVETATHKAASAAQTVIDGGEIDDVPSAPLHVVNGGEIDPVPPPHDDPTAPVMVPPSRKVLFVGLGLGAAVVAGAVAAGVARSKKGKKR